MMDMYLFSGTHWDREWYQTFQGFRIRLVKIIDAMLDVFETDEACGVFHFDGQTIVLEDYLEVRSENRERLERLIQAGKIKIGPWYCMPDELLLSGESLIKNLQEGFKLSRSFGTEPLMCGYVCDIFGHIAQMPQIFNNMGIKSAVMWRGLGDTDIPMFFDWLAPDGSTVRTVRLHPRKGYSSFTLSVLGRDRHATDIFTDEELAEKLKAHIDAELSRTNVPIIYLSDSLDHAPYHVQTPKYLEIIKKLYPDIAVHHENIENMFEKLAQYDGLPSVRGELYRFNSETGGETIINTLSSRYDIKYANDMIQTLLEKWAAPLYAFGKVNLPMSYIDIANRYLLQNQPHDSICGCSIDRVHENMAYRFNQAEEIAIEIISDFKNGSKKKITETDDIIVKIFNPLPYHIKRNVQIDVCFDKDYPAFFDEWRGHEKINGFKLFDYNGDEIEYGIADVRTNQVLRISDQISRRGDIYTLTFTASLDPMCASQYKIVPQSGSVRYMKRLKSTGRSAENQYISFDINFDGSINLTDKATGETYKNLLTPIDDAEIGDGWVHVAPLCDTAVTSSVGHIEKVEDNAVRVVFKVTQQIRVPRGIDRNALGFRRSEDYVNLQAVHFITLSECDSFISVKTVIDNKAENHRLRFVFPTEVQKGSYFANQAFCFVERPAGIDTSMQNYSEKPAVERQMNGIVLTYDGKRGFVFAAKHGLHEGGVDEYGNINVTFFRAFSSTVLTNGEIGGQLQGEMEFEYILKPLGEDISLGQIQRQQDIFQSGFEYTTYKGEFTEADTPSLIVEGNGIIYSTANKKDDGIEIRIYNPTSSKADGRLILGGEIKDAAATDFLSNTISKMKFQGNTLPVSLAPYEIATVKVILKRNV